MTAARATRGRASRIRTSIALALGVCLALTGCQIGGQGTDLDSQQAVDLPALDTLTPLEDPTSYVGPTTALVGKANVSPLETTPQAKLPVTVQSKDRAGDVAVEVTDTSRVLAISLTGTRRA